MKGYGEVAERLRRSTVQVIDSGRSGSGSGIIWNSGGLILTNAHVARTAKVEVELWDGTRLPAKVKKQDVRRDLAALQISASGLPAAVCGDSAALRPGELAIAIGNPLGFLGAVSTGVIHAVGTLPGFGGSRWVQSNVRLAPGNSGGPLANAQGEVIGVNTMIVRLEQGRNLALAVPSATVALFLSESPRKRAGAGITVRPVRVPPDNTVGFLILGTEPGSPAEQASLWLGDLIVGANGRRFRIADDLQEAIDSANGPLALQFRRGGSLQERTATLPLRQWKAAA